MFTSDAAKINQLEDQVERGEVTGLRKGAKDTWTIVKPVEAPADRNSVSDIVTNLANLEESARSTRTRPISKPTALQSRAST